MRWEGRVASYDLPTKRGRSAFNSSSLLLHHRLTSRVLPLVLSSSSRSFPSSRNPTTLLIETRQYLPQEIASKVPSSAVDPSETTSTTTPSLSPPLVVGPRLLSCLRSSGWHAVKMRLERMLMGWERWRGPEERRRWYCRRRESEEGGSGKGSQLGLRNARCRESEGQWNSCTYTLLPSRGVVKNLENGREGKKEGVGRGRRLQVLKRERASSRTVLLWLYKQSIIYRYKSQSLPFHHTVSISRILFHLKAQPFPFRIPSASLAWKSKRVSQLPSTS